MHMNVTVVAVPQEDYTSWQSGSAPPPHIRGVMRQSISTYGPLRNHS